MVIFHSYVNVYQRVTFDVLFGWIHTSNLSEEVIIKCHSVPDILSDYYISLLDHNPSIHRCIPCLSHMDILEFLGFIPHWWVVPPVASWFTNSMNY